MVWKSQRSLKIPLSCEIFCNFLHSLPNLQEKGSNNPTAIDCREDASSPPLELIGENIIGQPNPGSEPHYHLKRTSTKKRKLGDVHDSTTIRKCQKCKMEDDCSAFAHYAAMQLRQMTSWQKLLAQRLISEVCFLGQIGSLQITTTLTGQQVSTTLAGQASSTLTDHQANVPVFMDNTVRFPHGMNSSVAREPHHNSSVRAAVRVHGVGPNALSDWV